MQQTKPSRNSNNPSTFTDSKRKNTTFMSSASKSILRFDTIQQNLQLLKISLKKQSDRRQKLRKLLQKYNQIYSYQKKHVKQIKSSIIEMKDSNAACKLKIMIDPSILVENKVRIETRQYLCTLMNTFYRIYQENQRNNGVIGNLSTVMAFLIKGISYNQDMVFLMQRSQINQQIQLQGDLLAEKNRLKQSITKLKSTRQQHHQISQTYHKTSQKTTQKHQKILQLRQKLQILCEQSQCLSKNIKEQQQMKARCQDKIDTELLYHEKLRNQVELLEGYLGGLRRQAGGMVRGIYGCRVKEEENRGYGCASRGKTKRGLGEQLKQKMKFATQCQFTNLRS